MSADGLDQKALEGIKVLDLSRHISGPYCTKLLGALGAEVIKVEPPGRGDEARHLGPFRDDRPHPEGSALFLYLNTGKKGITLDLEKPSGRELLRLLIRETDVLVEKFDTVMELKPTAAGFQAMAGTDCDESRFAMRDMVVVALGAMVA